MKPFEIEIDGERQSFLCYDYERRSDIYFDGKTRRTVTYSTLKLYTEDSVHEYRLDIFIDDKICDRIPKAIKEIHHGGKDDVTESDESLVRKFVDYNPTCKIIFAAPIDDIWIEECNTNVLIENTVECMAEKIAPRPLTLREHGRLKDAMAHASPPSATPTVAAKEMKKSGKKRGRRREYDLKKDKRIADSWKTGRYKTIEQLGRAHDIKPREAYLTLKRVRWREQQLKRARD